MSETTEKLARLRGHMKDKELDAVVFSTRGNFAWLTGGGDNHVVSQTEAGFGALVVTLRQAYLVADTIEAPRIQAEEPVSAFTLKSHPWTIPLGVAVRRLIGDKKSVVCDDPLAMGYDPIDDEFRDGIRAELTVAEIRRYRHLGSDCNLVIETVARHLAIGDSGLQVSADLARHLLARGIEPHVLLVSFDERMKRYRHATPTANHLRHCAMLVVCGKRHGLIASLTRMVHFGPVAEDLAKRHLACCRVEAALWRATRPGAVWGEALRCGIEQYKAEGYPQEWELHHQGGPTGFSGRDFLVTPDEKRVVRANQAVAWNPSITGTKSEDTFILIGEDREVITACSGNWPILEVNLNGYKVSRPGILQR